MIARLAKPVLHMAACIALGAMVVGLLSKAGVSLELAQLTGNIGLAGALGLCFWRAGEFQPAAVFAAALITLASCLALAVVLLLALPGSLPLVWAFANVFSLGYVPLEGGIHGPPLTLFVTLWLFSMLGLIGAGLLLGGTLRLCRPRPEPADQG